MRSHCRPPANVVLLLIKYGRFVKKTLLVLAFALLIILFFSFLLPDRFKEGNSPDYLNYYAPVANNIVKGLGMVVEDGTIALRYPPGYPLILALFTVIGDWIPLSHSQNTQLLTLLSAGLSTVLIYWLARELWSEPWVFLAPLAWCTYPLLLWLTKQPNSEIPFLMFFYTAVYTFWLGLTRTKYLNLLFFISGLMLGFGMLIRPFALGLPLLFTLMLWFFRRQSGWQVRLQWTIVYLVGVLVFVLPWEIWLTQQTDQFYLLSSGAFPSVRDGLTFAVNEKGYRQSIQVPQDVELLMTDILNLSRSGDIRSISEMGDYLAVELGTRPLTIFKLMAIKAARSWYATDSGRYELPGLILQILYAVPLIWGSIVAWKQKNTLRMMTIFIWLLLVYAWLMTTAVLSIYRYMLPVASLLFVFMPGFFISLNQQYEKARKQTITR